jgi:DNA mismatch repair protein MutS
LAKSAKKETPLMKQYNAIKAKYPDALLLFRVGDFYETFGSDAVKAAKILDIILTKRGSGSQSETELAGFPHHSLNTYLPKLVRAGQRVAICDQLEDPKQAKKIVKRGVTELVTPGVALNDDILHSKSNNFLCAVHFDKKYLGVAFLDISTGEFLTSQGDVEYIDKLLQNFNPSEILISKKHKKDFETTFGMAYHRFYIEDWIFQADYAYESLTKHFKTKTLKGFGVDELFEGIIASGVVLHYLGETRHNQLDHIVGISRIAAEDYVWMDKFTIRNLELYHSTNVGAVTLINVIDKTISAMGGRTLKRWLALPLKQAEKIRQRHEVVHYLLEHNELLQKIRNQIKHIGDIERLISKIATSKVNPREVVQLKNSLEAIGPIKAMGRPAKVKRLNGLAEQLHTCDQLRDRIKETLFEEAPVNILKGQTIATGFSEELDELRNLSKSGKAYLDAMLQRESERTGSHL